MSNDHPRYLQALKRAHQPGSAGPTRSVVARSAAIGALLVLPAASCSNNDGAVFTDAADRTETSTTVGSTATAGNTITTLDGTTTVLDGSASATGAVFPSGAELLVDFTFESAGGGRARNPYVAVWIEDADGTLVKTISLWFEQSGKGSKWLSDLARWSSVSGRTADVSMSGATKEAGAYTVAWDGTDDAGNPVVQGTYVLNIEAARERGPHELISESIVIDGAGFSIDLEPDGELTAAAATLRV